MAVLKHHHDKEFTIVPNSIFRDKRLNLRDIGLLCYLLHLPNEWVFTVSGLVSMMEHDKKDGITASLKRIEQAGYLIRQRSRGKDGRLSESVWIVSDEPMTENPAQDFPAQDLAPVIKKETEKENMEERKKEAGSTMVQPEDRAELAGRPCDSDSSDKISFEQIESLFGTELLGDMIDFVTDYTEQHYPRYRHTNHPPVSRASKAVYAYKLLLCALELSLRPDQVKDCLINALRKEKKYDPRINLVTRPKTLGVWLADAMTVDMNAIRESRYNWMTDVSEYELDPFDEKRRPIYEHCISRWKALVLGN